MFSHSTTLPAPHHTCSHPVCGHYGDTARGRASSVQLQVFNSFWNKYFHIMCSTDAFRASSTWLESPMQVSGMSQSLTASRHVTPLSSYWPKKTQKEKREENKTEGQRVSLHKPQGTIWFKCWDVCKQLTLQSLQHSPLLHMALWVRVHFLQQFAPFRAHSYKSETVYSMYV